MIEKLKGKNFEIFPKFKHNLWTQDYHDPSQSYLTLSSGNYRVPTVDAEKFLKIRNMCTGHHTIQEIAKRSNMPEAEVSDIISSLRKIQATHESVTDMNGISRNDINLKLKAAVRIWAEQLRETDISVEFMQHDLPITIFKGWVLELYHYIKSFPEAIRAAVDACKDKDLSKLLVKYEKEERGHEIFVEKTLIRLGFSESEIKNSIPLVSTQNIHNMLCNLFRFEPASVLLVAAIIESANENEDAFQEFSKQIQNKYGLASDVMEPLYQHIRVDFQLGHARLLENNQHFLDTIKFENINVLINSIHDIKHSFDLQKLEIKQYYSTIGNYVPRQFVSYFAI